MNATLGVGVMAASLARSLFYASVGASEIATPNAVHMLTLCTRRIKARRRLRANVAQGDLGRSSPLAALIYAAERFHAACFWVRPSVSTRIPRCAK